MRTKKIQSKSILGTGSEDFRSKKSQTGNILDRPEEGLLEFYPAGYTKVSTRSGQTRQLSHKQIYDLAVSMEKENQFFPFGKGSTYEVKLIPEPENPHDPNAIAVILEAASGTALSHLNGADLGYVPRHISALLIKNLDMVNSAKILKTRAQVHGRYWQCKVIVAYGPEEFTSINKITRNRFSAIMEE